MDYLATKSWMWKEWKQFYSFNKNTSVLGNLSSNKSILKNASISTTF